MRMKKKPPGRSHRAANHRRNLCRSGLLGADLSNLATAIINVGLSIVLIRWFGLPGVAVATLIPVTIRAVAIIMPLACSRVGMPVTRFLFTAVWPAAWPAVIVLGGLSMVRHAASTSLIQAVLMGAATGLVYAALFLCLAIGRRDRTRYFEKLRSVAGWQQLETVPTGPAV